MPTKPTAFGAAITIALLALLTFSPQSHANSELGGDFTLHTTDSKSFSLHDARGQVVILFFGYTSCPDVCPTSLTMLGALMKRLGDQARRVQPLFVSVDPRRDTPKLLRSYLDHFNGSIIGLTGDVETLHRITKQYGTYFRYHGNLNANSYAVDHSGSFYLVDKRGHLAGILPYGMPLPQLVYSVQNLLKK